MAATTPDIPGLVGIKPRGKVVSEEWSGVEWSVYKVDVMLLHYKSAARADLRTISRWRPGSVLSWLPQQINV